MDAGEPSSAPHAGTASSLVQTIVLTLFPLGNVRQGESMGEMAVQSTVRHLRLPSGAPPPIPEQEETPVSLLNKCEEERKMLGDTAGTKRNSTAPWRGTDLGSPDWLLLSHWLANTAELQCLY